MPEGRAAPASSRRVPPLETSLFSKLVARAVAASRGTPAIAA
jgi:hypothetical protein